MTWLEVTRGDAPLIVSFPHTGIFIPPELEPAFASPWLARKDTDWWVHQLYDFARDLGATTVRTGVSRAVIDVNRDPSGASLYPGQTTTELCPISTFDGEPLYKAGTAPDAAEIARRRAAYFDPFHESLRVEIARLRAMHGHVVLYEAHAIRSRIPRLFDGLLPHFNIGTNGGVTCDPGLTRAVERACDATAFSRVTNGRFKGGWTTRAYGHPAQGVHAIQMELACRGYMEDPDEAATPHNWPRLYEADRAAPMRAALKNVLAAALNFAKSRKERTT